MEWVDATIDISIIIPAFNEARYLPDTLESIRRASEHLQSTSAVDVEVIVVDNNSTDGTAKVAASMGATVVPEPTQGIGRARNRGASVALGEVLVFVDADVYVPVTLLEAVCEAMSDPACLGGGRGGGLPASAAGDEGVPAVLETTREAHCNGPGPHPVLPPPRVRECRRLRRESLDRRGRRLLLEPEEAGQEDPTDCTHRAQSESGAIDTALRQATGLEGAALHKSGIHRAVSQVEVDVVGLVREAGTLGQGFRHLLKRRDSDLSIQDIASALKDQELH